MTNLRQIKKLSEKEELQLIEEYREGMSVNSLMVKYDFASRKSIIDKVKKHYPSEYKEITKEAKKNRKNYSINITKINCEFNAYFLGLMLSDGYIQDDNRFGIQLTDEDCIAFISEVTGKEYKAYEASEENHLTQYRIIFSDSEQVKDLEKYGVTKNKSKIIPALNLDKDEEKYIPYIIRGIIDGDGCIYKTTLDTLAFFIITASKDFAAWLKTVLEEKLYMKDIHITITTDGFYRVETAYYPNLLKLLVLVYDKPYGMNRKYELLRRMFRDYNEECLA